MNFDHTTATKSYVDIVPATPIFSQNFSKPTSFWPTPQTDARIERYTSGPPVSVRSSEPGLDTGSSSSQTLSTAASSADEGVEKSSINEHIVAQLATHTQHYHTQITLNLPPVQPCRQLSSTPGPDQSILGPASQPHLGQGLHTPPDSANLRDCKRSIFQEQAMADPRRVSGGGQRPMMGPPETPSRVMQASPNLFPSLQFSPDLFSTQTMGPMSAPIYPQQRLFWDPSISAQQHQIPQQYPNPYQDGFNMAFNAPPGAVPHFNTLPSQVQPYELPSQHPSTATPYLDNTAFPAPFQTSPRPLPPGDDNPTMFLSSPARRFGGPEVQNTTYSRRPVREVQAYHHQIEESRREMEIEQERRRSKVAKKAGDELIMQSVKRALSPSKTLRPGLHRSQTHSGISPPELRIQRKGRPSFNDSASASSATSNRSNRTGKISPLRQTSFAGASISKSFLKPRTAVSLAIDENGVAKTVLEAVSDSDDEMDVDDDAPSVTSSLDGHDAYMLRSQSASFSMGNNQDISLPNGRSGHFATARRNQNGAGTVSSNRMDRLHLDSLSGTRPDQRRLQEDTIRQPKRYAMHVDMPDNERRHVTGDAQRALKAIIQDRSRSISTQEDYPSSRHSDSSLQFHSSPPIQQSQFGTLAASPTTITDPDLATPSTDQEGFASLGAMRCICNSTSPGDSSPMVQCDSCSKWLHSKCIGIDRRMMPSPYICVYCEQTPVRHTANRSTARPNHRGSGQNASPLAHKSSRQRKTTR